MINVMIDGSRLKAEKGEFLLAIARKHGINIPSLCYHSALPPLGSCRLCIVELNEGGKSNKIVASCAYPLMRDCEVFTMTEKIYKRRRVIISMLHDRAPQDKYLLELCDDYEVCPKDRYIMPPNLKCVLCGRCAAACNALGNGAISTVGRGTAKKVSTPYDEESSDCIGCASCAKFCPVGAIELKEDAKTRKIWNKNFEFVLCSRCGAPVATREEIALLKTKLDFSERLDLCPKCRHRLEGV